MVLDTFDNNAWHFMTHLISTIDGNIMGENGYWDVWIPRPAKFTPATVWNYFDEIDGYFNLIVIEEGRSKTTYLPNFLSDGLQDLLTYFGYFNIPKNVRNIRIAQEHVYDILYIFNQCATFRMSLSWWLIFNPYQQPFDTLRTGVDWYLNFLTGGLPVIVGIDYGPMISMFILGFVVDYVRNLAIVVPYRYSDGIFVPGNDAGVIVDNPDVARVLERMNTDVRIFRKLPSIWVEKPIPDNLREYWAIKKPMVFDFLYKNYSDLGIQFFPDRIANSKTVSQVIDSHHYFETISTSLICLKTNLLSLPIPHFHF